RSGCLRPQLRHHRQRNAARAGVGRARDARVLEHDYAAREDLRERGRRADDLLRVGRGLRDELRRSRRQVPRSARRHVAADLTLSPVTYGLAARPSTFWSRNEVWTSSLRRCSMRTGKKPNFGAAHNQVERDEPARCWTNSCVSREPTPVCSVAGPLSVYSYVKTASWSATS